jgi:hypothetical protein
VPFWGVHKTDYISAASATIGTATMSYKCYGCNVFTIPLVSPSSIPIIGQRGCVILLLTTVYIFFLHPFA